MKKTKSKIVIEETKKAKRLFATMLPTTKPGNDCGLVWVG